MERCEYKKRDEIEIPVYFADSILVERKQTLYGSYAYSLKTEAGEFQIPIGVAKKGLLPKMLAVVEDCVKSGFSEDEFEGEEGGFESRGEAKQEGTLCFG
jgi:hypothetical protein